MRNWLFLLPLLITLSAGAQNFVPIKITVKLKHEGKPFESFEIHNLNSGTVSKIKKAQSAEITVNQGDRITAKAMQMQTDTLTAESNGQVLELRCMKVYEFEAVEYERDNRTAKIDASSVQLSQVSDERESFKAACCNLSESFETNPNVDVNFSDAVSGAKQITMLGLGSKYAQVTAENIPLTRGIASNLGLGYLPGTFIESIQLSKGAGSVVNGFESFTGQINAEIKKPEADEKLYLNLYMNQMGRTEANLLLTKKVSEKWSTAIMGHTDLWGLKVDMNKDGFLDVPVSQQNSIMNRWRYSSANGIEGQVGIKVLSENRIGGQWSYNSENRFNGRHWGMGILSDRVEGFAKTGYVFKKKGRSIGLIQNYVWQQQNSWFGMRTLNLNQNSYYANLIFQDIIGDTRYQYRTGLSLQSDLIDETYQGNRYARSEQVPGAFFEFTWAPTETFSVVSGLRADFSNIFGAFATPRLHAKYILNESSVIRLAAGTGRRTPTLFAENFGYMASGRELVIESSALAQQNKPYGLNQEYALNYGLAYTYDSKWFSKPVNITVDGFRTQFVNQIVTDLDRSNQAVYFYNLNGKSYANSFQAALTYKVHRRVELRVAHRYYDVKTNFSGITRQVPLLAANRSFANVAYSVKGWSVDVTANRISEKRLPGNLTGDSYLNHSAGQHHGGDFTGNLSPAYWLIHLQVTKAFKNNVDVYVGVENLGDFHQSKLIINPETPFNNNFDASMVWGPVIGRMIYVGMRYKLFKDPA